MQVPCIEPGRSRCPNCHTDSTHQNLNCYEQERQQRIDRNRRTLEGLGLTSNTPEQPRKASAVNKLKVSLPSEPTRRSKRISGEVEAPSPGTLGQPTCKTKQEVRRLVNNAREGSVKSHYAHNLMRVRYMSASALIKRIGNISNKAKMESFVQVLRDEGLSELAAEAQHKLAMLE